MDTLKIRPMQADEVALAVDWAAGEGWNPGLADPAAFYAADPGGFLVGTLGGEPVAVVSAVRYPENFAFLGFYIARPDMRGKGYGMALWNAAIARLEGCTIGLDGVVAQQANYRKSGFVLAYNNERYEGDGLARHVDERVIRPLHSVHWNEVLAFDRRFFPALRETFLKAWVSARGHRALAHVDGGRLRGYGVLRPCRMGFKVGPLFADDAEVAACLLAALAAGAEPGARIQLDMPTVNEAAVAMAKGQGMVPVFETARMYRGPAPEIEIAGQFGITTFELG